MGTTNKTVEVEQEQIVDDISQEDSTLAALKAKMAAKDKGTMPPRIVEKKTRSIKMGVIGSGQAGSRLAECFYKLGYESIAVNTAQQDLEHIELPQANKLLLNFGLGGAGKDLEIGSQAAESHKDSIADLVDSTLSNAQMFLFCTSLGGGSGAGSAETIVDILTSQEKPVAVITVLPMSTDDAQTKHNALITLAKFAKMAQAKKIDNLIVVDNAKIEAIYSDVGPLNFFKVSNRAIVEPIDIFNTLSSMPSDVKGLDPTEFGKLFTDGHGLSIFGTMTVSNYEEPTAIAEAVIEDLSNSLLAAGFNLKHSKYAGAIFTATKKVWDKIPNSSVNYAMSLINEACGNPNGVFRGIYTVDGDEDVVKVYSMFSGLSLPEDRVEQLKKETKDLTSANKQKDEQRNLSLKLDTGVDETVSAADAIRKRIEAKKSSFGKLHNSAVKDKRK